nr:thiamine-phosphate kinase [uncultured Sphingomonas sp.]
MSNTELAFIERLRRIANDPAARGLNDDVAVLGDLVLTQDSIAEGVHFLPDDPPSSVGWKLVAVNLSDLAAKGAAPVGALMSATIGDKEWDDAFLLGISAACETYGLALLGGDTIALPDGAPRVFSLTAIGRTDLPIPSRAGGTPGDRLWIIGTLGDAAAGLAALTNDQEAEGPMVEAYRRPIPQLVAGRALAPYARAMMDVSDGLLMDLGRMIRASDCGASIDLEALPLSRAFIANHGEDREARLFAATGGDDYALLCAFPPDFDPTVRVSLPSGTILVPIGTLTDGSQLKLVDRSGSVPMPEHLGYEHRYP